MKRITFNIDNFMNLITKISSYALAFCLIISTGGAWVNDVNLSLSQETLRWNILVILILVSLLYFFILVQKKLQLSSILKKKIFIIGLCAVTYLWQMQGDVDAYMGCFLLPIIWFVFFLIQVDDSAIVWKAFVNIVTIYALISLFYFFFGTCIKLISESGITEITWGTWDTSTIRTFHNLYYEAQFIKTNGTTLIARNCGVFAEAPMYNFVLCIALDVELFLSQKVHWWKIIILIITIITTFSTTGYLFLIITILLYFGGMIFSNEGMKIYKISFGILTLIGALSSVGILIQKMTTISGSGSVNVRTDHLLACIKAWLESPIIGVGYQNQDAVMNYETYKQGISVGLPYFLAIGGILLGTFIIFPYFITIKESLKKRHFDIVIFETLFLVIYFFTAVTEFPILTLFIAYILVIQDVDRNQDLREDKLKAILSNKLNSLENTFKIHKKTKGD